MVDMAFIDKGFKTYGYDMLVKLLKQFEIIIPPSIDEDLVGWRNPDGSYTTLGDIRRALDAEYDKEEASKWTTMATIKYEF